jgi:Gpi18-like mannosyltransferase
MNHKALILLLAIGLFSRLLVISYAGTLDVQYFIGWALAASELGIFELYPPNSLPFQSELFDHRYHLPVSYPPGSIYYLWIAGKLMAVLNLPPLIVIKLPVILVEVIATLCLYITAHKKFDPSKALLITASFWLNPAIIISGSMLGYQDGIAISLCLICGLAILSKRLYAAAILFALSLSIKQTSLFFFPILIIYAFKADGIKYVFKVIFVFTATLAVILSPYIIFVENGLAMLRHMQKISIHHVLSANALNLWWLIGGAIEINSWGSCWNFPTLENYFLTSKVSALHYLKIDTESMLPVVGRFLYIVYTLINCFILLISRNVTPLKYVLAAFLQYYGYSMLLTGVHENHALFAVALSTFLVFVSAPKYPRFIIIYLLITILVFSNLFLFYGLPLTEYGRPTIAIFNWLSLALSFVNVMLFIFTSLFIWANISKDNPSIDHKDPKSYSQ